MECTYTHIKSCHKRQQQHTTTHNSNTQQHTTTPPGASHRVVVEGLSTCQDSHLTGKPRAGQGSPLRVTPGVCRCSETSPMMGDTPSGVVARRTCPSGVASFGSREHPRTPEPCTERYDGQHHIRLGRRPGAPMWAPGWCGFRAGRGRRRCGSS